MMIGGTAVARSFGNAVMAGAAILVAAGTGISDARAQGGSVKALFEKYNLIGTFAWDCSKPPSRDNQYFINRVVDADHVQRDLMSGPSTRHSIAMIDKAAAL